MCHLYGRIGLNVDENKTGFKDVKLSRGGGSTFLTIKTISKETFVLSSAMRQIATNLHLPQVIITCRYKQSTTPTTISSIHTSQGIHRVVTSIFPFNKSEFSHGQHSPVAFAGGIYHSAVD